jgi:hypothetical protein
VESNPRIDIAVLQFAAPIPEAIVPLPLAVRVARHVRFAIAGWPWTRPFDDDVLLLGGIITGAEITIFDGVPAIQLYCGQVTVGTPLEGLSGSPIFVATTSGEAVIGVVRCSVVSSSRGRRAAEVMIYATPADAILRLWPDLSLC